MKLFPRLQFVTNSAHAFARTLCATQYCLRAGFDCVQYRVINPSIEEARSLQEACDSFRAMFIINDFVHLATEIEADGVWLGQNDMPAEEARQILGDEAFVGLSCNNIDEVIHANNLPIDAISVNGVFSTSSNPFITHFHCLDGIRMFREYSSLSIISIGGITADNFEEVPSAGSEGIAVSYPGYNECLGHMPEALSERS